MERKAVQSSNVASVGYDATMRVLEVQFKSGAVYQYHDVPSEVHRGLMAAPSVGSYLRQHIIPQYRAAKVAPASGGA